MHILPKKPRNEIPEYFVWHDMKRRCYNPQRKDYVHYGGRGIRVCDRWHDFAKFYADMGPRPNQYEIDRINSDGDYEPSNCRWASRTTQVRNTRRRKDGLHHPLGVCWINSSNSYHATIRVDGKCFYAPTKGLSLNEIAWMRDQWAIALHGDGARTNFEYI